MKTISVLFLSLLLFSCKESIEKKKQSTVGEISAIETLFNSEEQLSSIDSTLLNELGVCQFNYSDSSIVSPCSYRFYKLLEFNKTKTVSDAFLLQVKALTVMKGQRASLPMRHLIVFERENGKLVKVNGFRGNLIGTRESEGDVDDLIIRFFIPNEEAHFNCLFLWKDNRFRFESVEAIYGGGGNGSVKASAKKSISEDVYQVLMSNGMLF
tara:strand:+ start:25 stop:657 length:633 start_codon:yes stop_codon:yes gene_type:complete